MAIRFEYMWVTIPLLLIPMMIVVVQMVIIRIWMVASPVKVRERPEYSLHVMREPSEKAKKIVYAAQQPVIPARRPTYASSYQVARAPHVYRSTRSGMSSAQTSGMGTPTGYMTPSHQFQQFQSGGATPQYGRPPAYR